MDSLTSVKSLCVKLQHNAYLALWVVLGSFLMWLPTSFVIAAPSNRTYLQNTATVNQTKSSAPKNPLVKAERSKTDFSNTTNHLVAILTPPHVFSPNSYFAKISLFSFCHLSFITYSATNSRAPPFFQNLISFNHNLEMKNLSSYNSGNH